MITKFTNREQEVYNILVNTGKSYQEIADQMGIEITTVRSYIERIYQKLNVNSAKELIVYHYKTLIKEAYKTKRKETKDE